MYSADELSKYPYFQNQLAALDAPALHDTLTGVIARPFMLGFIHALIDAGTPFTLALIDLDNFKEINDHYGHRVGDGVLAYIGEKARAFFGADGVVGRFGGDEFLAVYLKSNAYDDVHDLFDALYKKDGVLRKTMTVNGVQAFVTATVGSAAFPNDAQDFDTLFSLIDKALYRGKSKGRNCYIIYVESKHAHLEIPTLTKRSLYNTFRQMGAVFDGEGTAKEKLAWAFLAVQENLRMDRLFRVDENGAVIDAQTGELLGVFPETMRLTRQDGMSAATNFDKLWLQVCPAFVMAMKAIRIQSALIMEVDHHHPEYGCLVMCPEIRTMRLWQDEEIAALYVLCRMLAGELGKTKQGFI